MSPVFSCPQASPHPMGSLPEGVSKGGKSALHLVIWDTLRVVHFRGELSLPDFILCCISPHSLPCFNK